MIKANKLLKEKGYFPIETLVTLFTWLFKNKMGYSPSEEKQSEWGRELSRTDTQIIIEDGQYTLWLDKYYIGFSEGRGTEYIYVTKEFFLEEISSIGDVLRRQCKSGMGLHREVKTMAKAISGDYYLLPSYKARLTRLKNHKRAIV